MVFVLAPFAADSIMEAVDADLDLVICITEGIPVLDMVKVKKYMQGRRTRRSVQTALVLLLQENVKSVLCRSHSQTRPYWRFITLWNINLRSRWSIICVRTWSIDVRWYRW